MMFACTAASNVPLASVFIWFSTSALGAKSLRAAVEDSATATTSFPDSPRTAEYGIIGSSGKDILAQRMPGSLSMFSRSAGTW